MVRNAGIFLLGFIAAFFVFLLRESSRGPLIPRQDSGEPPQIKTRADAESRKVPQLSSTPVPAAKVLPPPASGREIPWPVLLPDFNAIPQISAIVNEAEPNCRALVEDGMNMLPSGLYHDARKAFEQATNDCKSKRAGELSKWASCFAFYGQEPIGAFQGQDEKTYYLLRAGACWRTSLDFLSLEDGFGDLYSQTLLNATATELIFWRIQKDIVYKERDGAQIVTMLKQYLNRNPNGEYADIGRAVIREVEDELSKPRELRTTPKKD